MKISSLIKGSVCVLGLVATGSLLAAPANAGQASARGSAVVTRMDGSSLSVSGEVTLPSGMYYAGDVVVTPVYGADAATGNENFTTLTVAPGTPTASAANASNPVVTAVGAAITGAATVSEQSALIRAAGGSTGFTALD